MMTPGQRRGVDPYWPRGVPGDPRQAQFQAVVSEYRSVTPVPLFLAP